MKALWQKKKMKATPKPKTTITMLQESRNGGQFALRGYSYQFLYSCYLMLSEMNESVVFNLEGIEDIDYTICANDKNSITHIQLKYSTVRQDASFMSSVIKNFLETYLIDKNRSFKLVYDFVPAVGNLSKLFHGNLDADSRKYWKNVIEKIKKENVLWNWNVYEFDDFISKISFENVEKKSLEDSVECALIKRYNITTGNIKLFANGIKMFCVDKMENRGEITLKEIAQELWVYSKNCELLSADEDNVYLSHILTGIRERICSMLYEVKKHLSSEIYHDLNVLCDMTYKGKVFDDVGLNALILNYQYMEIE